MTCVKGLFREGSRRKTPQVACWTWCREKPLKVSAQAPEASSTDFIEESCRLQQAATSRQDDVSSKRLLRPDSASAGDARPGNLRLAVGTGAGQKPSPAADLRQDGVCACASLPLSAGGQEAAAASCCGP